ncbi:MAG: hypothetical protein EOO45_10025 [Flavobacterium sp.]|nr:MAG: hypothetical protein EOO45_10025 [Flavobacterium sp.]
MTLKEYQENASKTIQTYDSKDQQNFFLGYLGLAGEAGSVLTTLKKLIRDGEGFESFNDKLKEELGDVLWYITSIAAHYNFDLEDIAKANLFKTQDRFKVKEFHDLARFDENYPEKFPDSFCVNFIETDNGNNLREVKMILEKQNGESVDLGDPLTDNSRVANEYRFHDVFHLGHVAFLGWSPVVRHLMELKRKSDYMTLDSEDRGRAQVAEEAITLIIYNYAQRNDMLRNSKRIDTELLSMIKQLTLDLEISSVTGYIWEQAIIQSYIIFHEVVKNKGGRVLVSPKNRKLEYLGKN